MRASDLHRLAKLLREMALHTTENPGERRIAAHELAIVEDVIEHPNSSISQIVERTGVAQSMVSHAVSALRDVGVFETERDETDGRRVLVRVPERKLRQEFHRRGQREVSESDVAPIVPSCSAEQVEELLTLLERVIALTHPGRPAHPGSQ